jgi:hypothetical protein
VRRLLGKREAELDGWRDKLREALDLNGRLMVDLVPELKLIIGEQPPVADLPAQDAQSRFQMVFRRFIGVFARPEHPLGHARLEGLLDHPNLAFARTPNGDGAGLYIHLMQMIGWLMIALFIWLFHGPWLAFKRAVDVEDWPSAGATSFPQRSDRSVLLLRLDSEPGLASWHYRQHGPAQHRQWHMLTGNLTGNSANSAPQQRFSHLINELIQRLAAKFPTQRNREFLQP